MTNSKYPKTDKDWEITRLRRSECAVLPLVLEGRWYDMIASGKKREEYRDAKAYWDVRLAKYLRSLDEGDKHPIVGFSRGYKRPDMFFTVRRVFKRTTALHEEWGEPNGDHHVISLGFRIEFSN